MRAIGPMPVARLLCFVVCLSLHAQSQFSMALMC